MRISIARRALGLVVLAGGLALTGTASASVPGTVRAESPPTSTDSSNSKTVTVSCPSGKQVTGVGGEITGGAGEASITKMVPNDQLTSVTLRAEEVGFNSARQWNVKAYAMCANKIAGSQLVTSSRFGGPFNSVSQTAVCPAGKSLLGAGASIDQSTPGRVLLSGIRFSASNIAEALAQEIPGGDTANWRVNVHAICAPPLPGQVRGQKFSANDSATSKTRGIGCPAGKNLLGGAGFTVGGGQVVFDDLIPTTTGFTAFGHEDGDGFAGNWIAEAHAICA
jgi:hypothetical protein